MSGSCARLVAATFLAICAFTSSLQAQGYFEQKQRELAIQAQQTTADVLGTLEKSRQLEKTNAAEAKSMLEKSLLTVNDSSALDDKQRGDLRSRLLARLKEVDATVRGQKSAADVAGKSADKAAREEAERLAQQKLQDQQKAAYDLSKGFIDNGKKSLDAQKQILSAKEKGFGAVAQDLQKSASKMTEERITNYFIAKSDLRKVKLSKEETAILKALNSTITVDFSDKDTLKDVLAFLSDKVKASGSRLNIFADANSLRDAGVEYSTKVNDFKAEQITVRTVLKKVLADLGLTYVIKEGNINVITPDRAKDYLIVRAYPVQDLIAPFDLRWGPAANRVQMQQQANQLIQLIVNSIEPSTWQGVGERGYGTIFYNEATMSLIVRQTAEMHYMLGGGLGR